MHTMPTLAAAAVVMMALPAFASDYCTYASRDQWMSIADITKKAESSGFQVRKVERDDNCYEIKGTDKNGNWVEVYFDPVTGDVVKTERGS